MTLNRNPQKQHMADESMVRTLAAQTEAIWPQERELVASYAAMDITGTVESQIPRAQIF